MSGLYNVGAYPPSVRIAMRSMPPVATRIANYWMRDWPERTQRLLDSGDYLAMLALEIVWVEEVEGAVPPAGDGGTTNVISLAGRRSPPDPMRR